MKNRMNKMIVVFFITLAVISVISIAYAFDDYFELRSEKKVKPRGSVQYIYEGTDTIYEVTDIDTSSISLYYWHVKKGIVVIPKTGPILPETVVYDPVNDRLVLTFDTSSPDWPKKCSNASVEGTLLSGTKDFEASGPGWGWKKRG
jgi:hypothetical protein